MSVTFPLLTEPIPCKHIEGVFLRPEYQPPKGIVTDRALALDVLQNGICGSGGTKIDAPKKLGIPQAESVLAWYREEVGQLGKRALDLAEEESS